MPAGPLAQPGAPRDRLRQVDDFLAPFFEAEGAGEKSLPDLDALERFSDEAAIALKRLAELEQTLYGDGSVVSPSMAV